MSEFEKIMYRLVWNEQEYNDIMADGLIYNSDCHQILLEKPHTNLTAYAVIRIQLISLLEYQVLPAERSGSENPRYILNRSIPKDRIKLHRMLNVSGPKSDHEPAKYLYYSVFSNAEFESVLENGLSSKSRIIVLSTLPSTDILRVETFQVEVPHDIVLYECAELYWDDNDDFRREPNDPDNPKYVMAPGYSIPRESLALYKYDDRGIK